MKKREGKQEKEQRVKRHVKAWQQALLITLSVVLVLTSAIWIWWACADVESFGEGWKLLGDQFNDPENDVFYKDIYTVSDKKAKKWNDKVVANAGPATLDNATLQVYYWMNTLSFLAENGYYATAAGFNYDLPLCDQYYGDFGGTWEQFFLKDALTTWHNYQSMALMAEQKDLKLTETMEKDLNSLRDLLAKNAVDGGYASIDDMLHTEMGAGCTFEGYETYMRIYYMGYRYFETEYEKAKDNITIEILEEYYSKNQAAMNEDGISKTSGNVYDVRHILIKVGEEGDKTFTDAQWAECKEDAQTVLDEWLEGEKTEESFAILANKHSEDTGSNTKGGLYSGLNEQTQFVEEFKDWYLDESRKAGDYGLVKTDHGYHVMYFVGSEPQWQAVSREAILNNAANDIVADATEKYPMEVEYKDVALGHVPLTKTAAQPDVKSGWQFVMLGIVLVVTAAGVLTCLAAFKKK